MQIQDTNFLYYRFKRWRIGIFLLGSVLLISLLVYVWNEVTTPSLPLPVFTLQSQTYVQDLTFSPDSKTLAIGSSYDGVNVVEFWDVETRKLKHKSKSGEKVYVGAIGFSPNGKFLSTGYGGYTQPIYVWSVQTGELRQTFRGHQGNVNLVDFSRDGKKLMSASTYDEMIVRSWDVTSGKMLSAKKLQGVLTQEGVGHEFIRGAAFSPDQKVLAGGVSKHLSDYSEVGQLRLWDVGTGKLCGAFPSQGEGIFGLAFSPDGQTIATADYDTTIRVWDLQTQKLKFTLRGHRSPVVEVAFSSNGHLLISGSGDNLNNEPGEVFVWDISTRKLLKILTKKDKPVYSVAFSPNGEMMASSHDSKVKVWDTDSLHPQ